MFSHLKSGRPWKLRIGVVPVNHNDLSHVDLRARLKLVLKGIQLIFLHSLHFLGNFFVQVSQDGVPGRTPQLRVGVTLRRGSLLKVTLRGSCLVLDVDTLLDLLRLSVEG